MPHLGKFIALELVRGMIQAELATAKRRTFLWLGKNPCCNIGHLGPGICI